MSQLRVRSSPLNLRKIYEEEDDDNFVFSLREEIIENTLNSIEKIIQEKDVMNFVVDCAIDALKKVICLNFYFHTATFDVNHPNWSPDEPIPPSPPDSWTTRMVAITPQPTRIVTDEEGPKLEPCKCELGVDCLCLKSPEERIEQALTELFKDRRKKKKKSATLSPVSSSKRSSTRFSLPNTEQSVVEEESEKSAMEEMETSAIVKEEDELEREEDVKLPKIETRLETSVKEDKEESKVFDVELPPIRIDATFYCVPVESPPREKYHNKKKKKDKR